jgi:hypothetical protein
MSDGSQKDDSWQWSYSPFVGIMYGPIPVGVIIVLIIVVIAVAFGAFK